MPDQVTGSMAAPFKRAIDAGRYSWNTTKAPHHSGLYSETVEDILGFSL